TRFQATGLFTMFADVGHENPAKGIFPIAAAQRMRPDNLISCLAILLQEHDVAPGRGAEMSSVVIRISRPVKTVVRHMIPLFACDFASFAPDANTRIGEESNLDVIFHEGMPALIGALNSFADHNAFLCSGRLVLVTSGECSPWSARRRLFRMQIERATTRHVSVEPIFEGRTARQPARHDIARKCLGFHDRNVWLTRNGNQIIGGAAAYVPGATPMKWQGNLMYRFSIDLKRSSPATDERSRFNRAAQRNDAYVIAILDPEFDSQFWRNFCEHFRLEFCEMR